ncbi:syntaxin E [Guillardia theta CCMP2712]|uniref:Syntaxin E n=1 Tax=Guillardia theta (strain CCMP2712) TaxID=905079 RepID=L1IQ96_GUITC|nr:syntaxin E [Guillardia theta CCMP2712]EKX38418.1 syntaxin E [Guillardia theta CCMP2712]|eukprot:XP_005825398.1 syntaxin E [Guillardia theta CCMP2712]
MANNEFTSQHDLREKLHKVIEETKLLSQDTKGIIKDLTQIANGSYQGSGSGSQRHKIESRKLSDDFQKALQRFQEVVRTTLQKERESVARAKQAREADEEDEEREGLLERQTERSLQFMQDDQELQFTEALIFERQQGIKDIEKNVNDVNEIFRDLAILVSDQGHMLDDIESGIVNTAAHAESASEELKKAQANQKRARRTLFCLITVLVLVGALVILIVTKTI